MPAATIGPLAVGTAYVAADATFPGRMAAVDGRFVITLDPAPATTRGGDNATAG